MGLIKVGRFWWLDIWIEGKRFRRSLKTESKFEARVKAKEVERQLREQYAGGKPKFSDFCETYLEWAWSSKPASALREQQRLNKIREFFSGQEIIHLDDITPYHIERLRAELKKEKLSKTTINRYTQILRGLFYKAIDWEIYNKPNPLKKIRFYKENSRREALTATEMARVMQSAKEISESPRSPLQKCFHDIILLALNTGLRKSEILKLRWRDIKSEELIVEGKGGKRRLVPLNQTALEAIQRQPRKSEYVFEIPNRHQQDLLRRTVNQIRKRSKIDFHFHMLRHTFMTMLLERGVDLVTAGSILGHSKITTSLIYSHTDKDKKKRAVNLLNNSQS